MESEDTEINRISLEDSGFELGEKTHLKLQKSWEIIFLIVAIEEEGVTSHPKQDVTNEGNIVLPQILDKS